MCGRYVQKRAPLDLAKDWSPRGLYRPPRYEQLKLPIFNIAPTQPAMVVRADDITIMKWGLVPGWAKDEKIGNRMINARAETLVPRSRRFARPTASSDDISALLRPCPS